MPALFMTSPIQTAGNKMAHSFRRHIFWICFFFFKSYTIFTFVCLLLLMLLFVVFVVWGVSIKNKNPSYVRPKKKKMEQTRPQTEREGKKQLLSVFKSLFQCLFPIDRDRSASSLRREHVGKCLHNSKLQACSALQYPPFKLQSVCNRQLKLDQRCLS